MAPELLRQECPNNEMTDCYAFGILLYEMYSRQDPYEGEEWEKVLKEVADEKINKRPPIPDSCPQRVGSLMSDCLHRKPAKRPTFEELELTLRRSDAETLGPKREKTRLEKGNFPKRVAEDLSKGKNRVNW